MIRRVLAAVAIVATVSTTVWIRDRAPQVEDWQVPFLDHGSIGEPVDVGDFAITVEGVDGGRGMVGTSGQARPTGGVWLLVTVAVSADRTPARPRTVWLVDDRGRRFEPSPRPNQPMLDTPVQPGMVATGAIAFEVPLDVGARVSFRAGPPDATLDDVAAIDIPIPGDRWAHWTADGSTVEVPGRTVAAA